METTLLLTEIVNVLKANQLKPSGNESRGYVAFCPKHDDTNTKSFSVGVGEKGLVMHCFANCSTYQQFKEWFSAKGVNFPKKAQAPDADGMVWKYITIEQWGVFPFKWPEDRAEPIMEKLYVYRRKDGTPYAFKMRFAPKDFRRFRIEGGKIRPSWKGLKMDPYNWDVACKAAAEGRPVVHVEGEKDADNVVEHLKYAAFSCGGVSDHWNDDWNADLEGAPGIIFVADNDLVKGNKKEPGLKKAQEYCEQVHKFKPVKLLMFNDHKDSTDFIKAGGNRADFTAKIKSTKQWEMPEWRKPVVPDHVPAELKPTSATPVIEVKVNPNAIDWSRYPYAPCTDSANAIRLLRNHGNKIRVVSKKQIFYVHNGKHWEPDHKNQVQEYCKEVSKRIFAEEIPSADFSIRTELDAWAKNCQDMSRIRAMKAAALSLPELQVDIRQFDTKATSHLFNCNNGTLNFDTGVLQPYDPADMITHISPCDYEAELPARWMEHIYRAFGGDQEMIEWWHIYMGYCFTADTYFQKYAYLEGPAGTGKGMTHQTLQHVMGTYYGTIDPQSLCEVDQRSAGADSDLDDTRGKRIILAAEMKGNQKLDEQIVKSLTGGDTIRTKQMNQNKTDLEGFGHLWFTGNERAKVSPSDAIQRRLMTIPFREKFPEEKWVEDYHRILAQEEGGQIIHLAMLGVQAANLKRLAMLPQKVTKGNADYMREVNLAAQWKAARVRKLSGGRIVVHQAYKDFRDFVHEEGGRPWMKPTFLKALQTEGMFTELDELNVTVFKDFHLI